MNFPQSISLTITNHCNLRCQMCGQWSEEGYIRRNRDSLKHEMALADWMRVVDELAAHGIKSLLLRGGEAFMLPGIIELLDYIHARGCSFLLIPMERCSSYMPKISFELEICI